MYNIILQETDLITESQFPAIALINEAFNENPIEFVNNLTNGVGSGYNYSSCSFWSELDDYEKSSIEKFDGLLISTEDNEEIVVSISDFAHYLTIACDRLKASGFKELQTLKEKVELLKTKQ